jgi:hypothetical protein
MSKPADYPARPPFFALKFIRLMAKTALGNELGADVIGLLSVIAATEDAKGYRGPVNFHNAQLMMILGVASFCRLSRMRKAASRAGWLVFRPGSSRVPPTYFVTVPERFRGVSDGASDEHPGKYFTPTIGDFGISISDDPATSRHIDQSSVSDGSVMNKSASLPIPSPSPSPSPKRILAESAEPDPASENDQPATRKRKPKPPARKEPAPRERNELFDAVAEVTGADPKLNGGQIGKAAADLKAAGYGVADVRKFAAKFLQLCPWARGERTRPEVGELVKHIAKVREAQSDLFTPVHERPGYDPKLGFVPTPGLTYFNPLTD